MEYITLNTGAKMPALGFGTFGLPADGTTKRCVLAALKAGYRHIDTAHAYLNEREAGEAIKESGVKREDIWLTTKIWPTEHPDAEAAVRHGKVRSIGISNFKRSGCDSRYFHCSHLSQR